MLTDWVTAGGNLIAMRPDAQLAGLLGLTRTSGTLPAAGRFTPICGSTQIQPPAWVWSDQTIQYHGLADLYTLNGASALATPVLERHDRYQPSRRFT